MNETTPSSMQENRGSNRDQKRDSNRASSRDDGRARRRWLGVRSVMLMLAIVVLAIVGVYWLFNSLRGRDVLLDQIVARLPPGVELRWSRAEGPATGPMTLYDVRYLQRSCPDANGQPVAWPNCATPQITTFAAKRVTLDPTLRPLLGRTLRLETLEIADAALVLPESDEPFELPRWPESLPRIAPPLALQAQAIRIDRFAILRREGKRMLPLIRIDALRGGVEAEDGRLLINDIAADTDRGRFTLRGEYAPRDRYRMNIAATAVLPAPAGRTPARLGAIARGDLSALDVGVGGSAPGSLRIALALRGERDPQWTLTARGERLRLSALTGEDVDDAAYALALRLRGDDGAARLDGRIAQTVAQTISQTIANKNTKIDATTNTSAQEQQRAIVILPSRVSLREQVLTLAPLSLALLDGRADFRGRLDVRTPADPRFDGTLAARGLRWRGDDKAAIEIVGDGDLVLVGRLHEWSAKGDATLLRAGERAKLALDARGDAKHANIATLRATMPSGTLDGSGRIDWAPTLRWRADARLAGFDPGYLLPDWPGAVNGRVRSEGAARDDGAIDLRADASDIGGRLRGRALQGRANVQLRLPAAPQTRIDGEGEIALRIGDSRIDARGKVADTLAIDAEFAPLRLNDLLPQAQGSLRGTLRLSGARTQPNIDTDVVGVDLNYAGYRALSLRARGRLPWNAGANGALAIDAENVEAGIALQRVHIDARGALQALRIDAEGESDALGRIALAGDLAQRDGRWQGMLSSLRLAPPTGPAWRLQAPARFAQTAAGGWQLASSCFNNESSNESSNESGNASGNPSDMGGSLCASADWPARLDVRGDALPVAWLTPYMEDALPARDARTRWVVSGTAELDARIRGDGASWTGTAALRSSNGTLAQIARARRDVLVYRDLRANAQFGPSRIEATLDAGLRAEGTVRARIATGWDADAPLSGEIAIDAREITWMELFSPDIVAPTGRLVGTLALGGRLGQPTFGGQAHLTEFRTEMPALAVSLRDGDLRMDAQPDGSARISGSVRSGEGTLRVDGTLGWREGDTPLLLALRGENVLISDTRELRAIISPNVEVRYAVGQPIAVSGELRVVSAKIALEGLSEGVSASPDVVVRDPANPQRTASAPLDLNLALTMGDDVRLYGFGLEGTLGGSVRMRARPGRETVATGTLDIDGRYTAYGQKLQIERGRLLWSNTPFANPILDIRAQRVVGGVTAGIDVKGRASAPDAQIWSDPATSEAEALSYLALGRPLSTASADENRRLSAATAALSAGNLLAAQLGQKIGLDDAGVLESRALGGSVLGVGKYLSPRVYVSYGVSLLGTGQVITLKYLLRKGFDIEIESSTVENRGSVNWRREK
jgi:translocation and assembly module TamB